MKELKESVGWRKLSVHTESLTLSSDYKIRKPLNSSLCTAVPPLKKNRKGASVIYR